MREIPQCWLTGHAAGVAAALAAKGAIEPRHVDVHAIRRVLREQGAHLSDDTALASAREDALAASDVRLRAPMFLKCST